MNQDAAERSANGADLLAAMLLFELWREALDRNYAVRLRSYARR
jgi:hypothetical protein